jgi:hypothetical protein
VWTSGVDFHLVPVIPMTKYNKVTVAQPTLIVPLILAAGTKCNIIDTIYYWFSSFSFRGLLFNFILSVKYVGFNYESGFNLIALSRNSDLFERSSLIKPYDAIYIHDKLSVWKGTRLLIK